MSIIAAVTEAAGGPFVLSDVEVGELRSDEVLISISAAGICHTDLICRDQWIPVPLPAVLGHEGAGVVLAVGDGVTVVKPGDRVAYAGPIGGYATERVLPADRLVKLPDAISFETGAAMMLQGMTAQYLIHRTHQVKSGETIVVHAAAGGVGLILCQWAKHLGATVIGVVSTEEKAALAKANGAAHAVVGYAGLTAEVKKITGGTMVPVVYDSVGKDTWAASLDCLAPLGLMVSYGNASGPVAPFDLGVLGAKGSLYLTRPTLPTYTAKRSDLEAVAEDLFSAVISGSVKIQVNQTFPLRDAAKAHIALESRKTTGSTVLIP